MFSRTFLLYNGVRAENKLGKIRRQNIDIHQEYLRSIPPELPSNENVTSHVIDAGGSLEDSDLSYVSADHVSFLESTSLSQSQSKTSSRLELESELGAEGMECRDTESGDGQTLLDMGSSVNGKPQFQSSTGFPEGWLEHFGIGPGKKFRVTINRFHDLHPNLKLPIMRHQRGGVPISAGPEDVTTACQGVFDAMGSYKDNHIKWRHNEHGLEEGKGVWLAAEVLSPGTIQIGTSTNLGGGKYKFGQNDENNDGIDSTTTKYKLSSSNIVGTEIEWTLRCSCDGPFYKFKTQPEMLRQMTKLKIRRTADRYPTRKSKDKVGAHNGDSNPSPLQVMIEIEPVDSLGSRLSSIVPTQCNAWGCPVKKFGASDENKCNEATGSCNSEVCCGISKWFI